MKAEHYAGCARSYGVPLEISVWFMFDNHTFEKIAGTPDEMGRQILECMEDDWGGYVATRFVRNGPTIDALTFHGTGKPDTTRERIEKWVSDFKILTT